MRLTTLAALAALAPCAATAATQGTIPVDPDKQVSGTFSAPGTQTWRLYLKAGKDYVVTGPVPEACFTVAVRAAGGRVLGSFSMSEPDTTDGPEGVSFRAPYAGLYTVEVTAPAADFGPDGCAASVKGAARYALSAARDCPGDASTRCAIAVGQTLQNLRLDYQNDADWFRATLAAGHAYQATLAGEYHCADFAVLDAGGRPVAQTDCLGTDGDTLTFTAPASGAYYLAAASHADPPETYSLSLAPARHG